MIYCLVTIATVTGFIGITDIVVITRNSATSCTGGFTNIFC